MPAFLFSRHKAWLRKTTPELGRIDRRLSCKNISLGGALMASFLVYVLLFAVTCGFGWWARGIH